MIITSLSSLWELWECMNVLTAVTTVTPDITNLLQAIETVKEELKLFQFLIRSMIFIVLIMKKWHATRRISKGYLNQSTSFDGDVFAFSAALSSFTRIFGDSTRLQPEEKIDSYQLW